MSKISLRVRGAGFTAFTLQSDIVLFRDYWLTRSDINVTAAPLCRRCRAKSFHVINSVGGLHAL